MENKFIVGGRGSGANAVAVIMKPQREYSKAEAINLMAHLAIVLMIEPSEIETAINEAMD
jgi:hypothetical protein